MELLTAIFNMDPAQLTVAGMVILAVFGGGLSGGSSQDEDDAVYEYETASWNPSSVNYSE